MRTVDSRVLLPSESTRKRPASTIVAKDTTPYTCYCGELASGDVLVIESSGHAEPPVGRLLRRKAGTFALEAELVGVNGPAAISPNGRWLLAGGPMLRGEAASCVLVDLAAWRITRTLPLIRPFAWIDDTHVVAQTPRWETSFESGKAIRRDERVVDPAIAVSAPQLMTAAHAMVLVDLGAESARPLLECQLLDEESCIALSPERDVAYTATSFSRFSAVRIADGGLLWQKPPVRLVTHGATKALVFDAFRRRIFAVGIGNRDVLALDPATGAELEQMEITHLARRAGFLDSAGLWSVAARPDGLVVMATEKGVLIEHWPDGHWEALKLASRSVDALSFLRGGTALLAGGAEKNLRVMSYAE